MPDQITVPVMKCSACGALDAGPREACPKCHARKLETVDLPGQGRLVSWTMIRRPPAAYREDGAYAVAVVMLDAGLQVTGRMSHPGEQVKPGSRVHAAGRLRDTIVFDVEA
jgi:uncharacterized OB-fold protein